MAEIHTLDGVRLGVIDRATVRLLAVILDVADASGLAVVTITSGSDGAHSGPDDPHHHGHALDLRSHDFPTRGAATGFVNGLQSVLGDAFFCFLEDPDTPNAHIHVQVRRGAQYPPPTRAASGPRVT